MEVVVRLSPWAVPWPGLGSVAEREMPTSLPLDLIELDRTQGRREGERGLDRERERGM